MGNKISTKISETILLYFYMNPKYLGKSSVEPSK